MGQQQPDLTPCMGPFRGPKFDITVHYICPVALSLGNMLFINLTFLFLFVRFFPKEKEVETNDHRKFIN